MSGHLSGLSRKTQTAPSVYTGRTGGLGEGGAEVGETGAALDLHQLPRPPRLVSPALGIAPAVGPAHAKGLMEEEGRGAGVLTVKGGRPEQRQGPGCGSLISSGKNLDLIPGGETLPCSSPYLSHAHLQKATPPIHTFSPLLNTLTASGLFNPTQTLAWKVPCDIPLPLSPAPPSQPHPGRALTTHTGSGGNSPCGPQL